MILNLRDADQYPPAQAVAFGVIYGLLINIYIWPYEARRELRRGLSDYLLNSAHLYLSIVRQYSDPPDGLVDAGHRRGQSSGDGEPDESTALLGAHLDRVEEECIKMEVYLQQSLIKVGSLLALWPIILPLANSLPTVPLTP